MANYGNQSAQKREYPTDEKGMMNLAKDYAKKEYSQSVKLIRELGITEEELSDEIIGKTLILLKYNNIKNASETRVTFFDH